MQVRNERGGVRGVFSRARTREGFAGNQGGNHGHGSHLRLVRTANFRDRGGECLRPRLQEPDRQEISHAVKMKSQQKNHPKIMPKLRANGHGRFPAMKA